MIIDLKHLPLEHARVATHDDDCMIFKNGQETFTHVMTGERRTEELYNRSKVYNSNHTLTRMRVVKDGVDFCLIRERTLLGNFALWWQTHITPKLASRPAA